MMRMRPKARVVILDKDSIVAAACRPVPEPLDTQPFGAGDAAQRIVDCLETTHAPVLNAAGILGCEISI